MKKSQMVDGIKRIEVVYGKSLTEDQVEIWGDFFWEWDNDVFLEIINEAIRTCRFMPTIADLCKIKEENDRKFVESGQKIFVQDGVNKTEYRYIRDEKRISEVR